VEEERLRLTGLVADPLGRRLLRDSLEGDANDAEAIGVKLAETLLDEGAGQILEEFNG
jgi:hydroxymethylbilane synthase